MMECLYAEPKTEGLHYGVTHWINGCSVDIPNIFPVF